MVSRIPYNSCTDVVFTALQVRVGDNVVVTATGMELLTNVPRTVEEIEAWMQQGEKTWKPLPPT